MLISCRCNILLGRHPTIQGKIQGTIQGTIQRTIQGEPAGFNAFNANAAENRIAAELQNMASEKQNAELRARRGSLL
jgi:hypothetical protein